MISTLAATVRCMVSTPGLVQVNMAVASLIESQMPIKRLLLLLDIARQDVPAGIPTPLMKWNQTIRDVAG